MKKYDLDTKKAILYGIFATIGVVMFCILGFVNAGWIDFNSDESMAKLWASPNPYILLVSVILIFFLATELVYGFLIKDHKINKETKKFNTTDKKMSAIGSGISAVIAFFAGHYAGGFFSMMIISAGYEILKAIFGNLITSGIIFGTITLIVLAIKGWFKLNKEWAKRELGEANIGKDEKKKDEEYY